MLKLQGSIEIPGDKSISHRALIFAALSSGKTKISNLLESEDIKSTINVLIGLGINIKIIGLSWVMAHQVSYSLTVPLTVETVEPLQD